MKTSTFIVRVWRLLSVVGFLVALYSSYISYPEEVAVRFADDTTAIQYLNRETIFYIAVGFFLSSYVLFNSLIGLFPRIASAQLPLPSGSVWRAHRSQLNQVVIDWLYAMMAAVNTVLALSLVVLSLLNRADRTIRFLDYGLLLPISVAILVGVMVALPIRLYLKPAEHER